MLPDEPRLQGPRFLLPCRDGRNVQTVNTAQGYKYTGPAPIPNDNQNQFYGNGAHLYARTFNRPQKLADYQGRCYLVPLSTVQLTDGSNLLPSDNNGRYPESKRCVIFRAGGNTPGGNLECWPEGQLESNWAAFEAATGAAIRRALEEDARNVTGCAADRRALQRVLVDEAAWLSAMLSGCPGNVSMYVFQQMVLGAQSTEAQALELVLSDDAGVPGRKLLGWLSGLKRKAGRALTAVVRTPVRIAGNPQPNVLCHDG